MRRFIGKILRRLGLMDDPYYAGYDAYLAYERVENNPFIEGSIAWCEWEMGWTAAEDADYSYACNMEK